MGNSFEWASGSIPGRTHVGSGRLLVGKNNQDACCVRISPGAIVAAVCDGCGSGKYSEFGARLGSRLIAESLFRRILLADKPFGPRPETVLSDILEDTRCEVVVKLRRLAMEMGGRLAEVVHDYLLFTVVAAVVTPEWTWIASLGDGVIFVNDRLIRLGPFPDNAPPYLAYALTSAHGQGPRFQIEQIVPTSEVRSLLIGTDGVNDLIDAQDQPVPGKMETVGPIRRFWNDDYYFANPDAVRRRLALINSESIRQDPRTSRLQRSPGLLPDDTTLVAIRRKPLVKRS